MEARTLSAPRSDPDGRAPATDRPIATSTVAGAIAVALVAALCFPLVTTAVAYAPPLYVGGLRALVAAAVVLPIAVALRRPRPRGRQWIAVVAIGATWSALGFAGMLLAGGRIEPGLATVLASTQPLIAAAIGRSVLGERLGRWGSTGMVLAFAGAAVAALAGGGVAGSSIAGAAFVIAGATGIAIGNVLAKRFAAELDPLATTAWQLVVGAAILLAAAPFTAPASAIRWTAPLVLAIAALGIAGTAVAFLLWLALLHRAPLSAVNVFNFITPVFGLAIGAALYGERPGAVELAGAVLVITGASLTARSVAMRSGTSSGEPARSV